jgi:hypothetical protein
VQEIFAAAVARQFLLDVFLVAVQEVGNSLM